MSQWILKHKKNKVYLKILKDGYKHYVVDVDKASRFNKRRAEIYLKKFKHPENWIMIERGQNKGVNFEDDKEY